MSDAERYRTALETIDRILTTVEGDNIPRGSAPALSARELARQALAASSHVGGSEAADENRVQNERGEYIPSDWGKMEFGPGDWIINLRSRSGAADV